jgi:hypothetical protein
VECRESFGVKSIRGGGIGTLVAQRQDLDLHGRSGAKGTGYPGG